MCAFYIRRVGMTNAETDCLTTNNRRQSCLRKFPSFSMWTENGKQLKKRKIDLFCCYASACLRKISFILISFLKSAIFVFFSFFLFCSSRKLIVHIIKNSCICRICHCKRPQPLSRSLRLSKLFNIDYLRPHTSFGFDGTL